MASIKLGQLQTTGSELFQDSESFLNEMSDINSISVYGGGSYDFSDMSIFTKLAEAFVNTYGIGHIAYLAKSYSDYEY
ncbi:hypothetical protein [Cylindrospermopsis raciborskii]|uniref:Uncharacterized protein n=1 Tax=Cylindrospermopsis raciborskii CENA302 TaxID=1170768 RepID=A0A9Q5W7K1_9CYAN|nr:hypothetical protein [Cylindrospermopsis raciborskii]MCZ2201004.1 hypothetical protein [Cylindrospermopsis raciborskii PAMP2012]MCZ2206151.1 hypothetical protein [Cylindrospermopsis raciborskii PAMP2011]NLQ06075.1 hypothetical protein [Cylindrospermopsis raciborskii MVCC19]OHY32386.1 hypothetical protein BCV64_13015 [Cylindrospermopsis raciborskii MVCC14]OPH08696.1 hypothetical protein CENA302_14320 [Cylindrospermopsis raciborskii CENA302]